MEPAVISLSQHMMTYQKMMCELVCEKASTTPEKKALKESALREIVKEKFAIIGDEAFCERINADINQILSVKPGRKLIKALSKYEQKITIKAGPESLFNRNTFCVSIDTKEIQYTSLFGWSLQHPCCASLAHELIHAFQKLENRNESYGQKPNCLIKDMDDIYEQDAIVAMWWYSETHHKIIKSKIDVLCENAFLFALGYPPRINHRGDGLFHVDVNFIHTNYLPGTIEFNYHFWLERSAEMASVAQKYRDNPLELPTISEQFLNLPYYMNSLFIEEPGLLKFFPTYLNNREYLLGVFVINPAAIMHLESDPRGIKLDVLFTNHPKLIVHCPSLRKDLYFMSSIIEKSPEVITHLQKEDLKDRDFVLKCLSLLPKLRDFEIYNDSFCWEVDFSLCSDPEIQKHNTLFYLRAKIEKGH